MVTVSTLLPNELLSHVCEGLGTADLIALMRCGQLGRELGDIELWRRLVHVFSPFLQLFPTLLQEFFQLMENTRLAIVGDAVLDVLLFTKHADDTASNDVQELHIAVNNKSFQSVIAFFRRAGYTGFEVVQCGGSELPQPNTVVESASGVMTSEKVRTACVANIRPHI
jgi:hypothetical protein